MSRLAFIVAIIFVTAAYAAEPSTRPAPDADLKAISQQLSSASADDRRPGIAAIREMIQQQPARAIAALRGSWAKQLLDAKEYAALDELCLSMILSTPGEGYAIEPLLQFRIRAAIAQGKTDVALSHSKSLYNIASMSTTNNAMLLVAECLSASSPKDLSRLNQFKAEQMAGAKVAETPTTNVYSQRPAYGSPVLASIRVDAEPYLQKAGTLFAEDYWSLTGRGNLMLLADRPADAMELFERAYSVAAENQLASASESVARCIKAQDGVIGRANTWVLAIRPKQGGAK